MGHPTVKEVQEKVSEGMRGWLLVLIRPEGEGSAVGGLGMLIVC